MRGGFAHLPATTQGRLAVWSFMAFAVALAVFLVAWVPMAGTSGSAGGRGMVVQLAAAAMGPTGLASSGLALFALIWKRERSWTVYAAMLPLAFVVLVVLLEVGQAVLGLEA